MPLSHAPGHAQCDFGEALAVIGGVERKAHYFVLDRPHSDGCFVKAYSAETTEAFLKGYWPRLPSGWSAPEHPVRSAKGGLAVARILGDGGASAPVRSPSSSATTCSKTVSVVPARATTK